MFPVSNGQDKTAVGKMLIKVSIHPPHVPGPILKRLVSLSKLQHLRVVSALVKTLNFLPFTQAIGF